MDIFERRVVDVQPLKREGGLVKARFTFDNGEEIEAYVKHMFDDEFINDKEITRSYERNSKHPE